jgi:hypothetical protein
MSRVFSRVTLLAGSCVFSLVAFVVIASRAIHHHFFVGPNFFSPGKKPVRWIFYQL